MLENVVLRRGTESDVEDVVHVHLQSFQGFFLSFLGPKFLRLLYRNIIKDPEGILIVACTGKKLVGFVAGATHQQGFYRRLLLRRWWAFSIASVGALTRRPAIAPRLLRALGKSRTAADASAQACLMSIAVLPGISGRGIGQALVNGFCDELKRLDIHDVCLTTDRDGNDEVNMFYQKLGFTLSRVYLTPEGRKINEYYRSLRDLTA